MNIENLTPEEMMTLKNLLKKIGTENVDIPGKVLVDEIIDNFNFNKVHKVMEYLDWKVDYSNNNVPTIIELKNFARKLINEAISLRLLNYLDVDYNTPISLESAGFKVTVFCNKEKNDIDSLTLYFNITSWDANNDEGF
jgi:hypothetical protein